MFKTASFYNNIEKVRAKLPLFSFQKTRSLPRRSFLLSIKLYSYSTTDYFSTEHGKIPAVRPRRGC